MNKNDTIRQKANYWTLATGQKTAWFTVWQNIFITLLAIVSVINLVNTFFTAMESDIFIPIPLVETIMGVVFSAVAFFLTRKCDEVSFIANIAFICWQILTSIVSVFTIGTFNSTIERTVEEVFAGVNPSDIEGLSIIQSFVDTVEFISSAVIIVTSSVMILLQILNLVYFAKRRGIYKKTVEELSSMACEKGQQGL